MLSRRSIMALMGSAVVGGYMDCSWAAEDAVPLGEWQGTLSAGSQSFRLTFRILSSTRGELINLDGSAEPAQADLQISGSKLIATFPTGQARFVGRHEGDRLIGEWQEGGMRFPHTFTRGSAPSFSGQAPATALTPSSLDNLRLASGAPALGAGWQKRGGAPRILASGKRAADAAAAVTTDDLWHLGSVTKSMTATLVARLVDSGAVRWTDTIAGVLGTQIPEMNAAYRDVNFLHLLSHHSGLPSDIPEKQWQRYFTATGTPASQRPGFAALALAQTPVGTAGKDFQYSNLGFTIAALMLETRTGMPWETLIAEQVFAPLKLKTAGFGIPVSGRDVRQPVGHAAIGADSPDAKLVAARPETGRPVDNPPVIGPAGNVHMSIADLLIFLAAHRDRNALLSAASWERLHTPPFGATQALGLMVSPDGSLWHNGSNTLWYCEVCIDPARGIAAAAVANRFSGSSRAAVAHALAAARSAATG